MPREITMPQQSDTMTEGVLVSWNVKEGDKYAEGDIVAEIETDKATMEMEGPDEPGTIAAILVQPGDKVPVGATIAVIATDGEDEAEVKKGAGSASSGSSTKNETSKQEESGDNSSDEGTSDAATATLEKPTESNGQTRKPADSDYGGPQRVSIDMPAANDGASNGHEQGGGRVVASPLARRIAQNEGIDIGNIKGSGPGGRVVKKDVLSFNQSGGAARAGAGKQSAPAEAKAAGPVPTVPDRVPSGKTEVVELSKMRMAIAKQLVASKQNLPHFYETIEIELDAAEALRETLNKSLESQGIRLSIGDLIAKAVAVTLKIYPVLNSTFDGMKVTRHGDVHLGMAVALDNGLIVPVLKNIDQMGFREIRLRSKELVDNARAQKLKGEEMKGATFTVSNLGAFGIREFVAIINPPEVGILAIGAGQKRPVVDAKSGEIVARTVMAVTLSADHRVVDGADSARFLSTLKQMLEEPGMMLV